MKTDSLPFSVALELLKRGYLIARKGWKGKNMWLKLLHPVEDNKMTLPRIFMSTADDNLVPWLASQTDLLADDWSIL